MLFRSGSMEYPPVRTGVGNNDPYLYPNRLQDNMTEIRRAKYGQDPAFMMRTGETSNIAESDVNDVKTKRNAFIYSSDFDFAEFDSSEFDVDFEEVVPTMLEQIRNPLNQTSYGRASTQ